MAEERNFHNFSSTNPNPTDEEVSYRNKVFWFLLTDVACGRIECRVRIPRKEITERMQKNMPFMTVADMAQLVSYNLAVIETTGLLHQLGDNTVIFGTTIKFSDTPDPQFSRFY